MIRLMTQIILFVALAAVVVKLAGVANQMARHKSVSVTESSSSEAGTKTGRDEQLPKVRREPASAYKQTLSRPIFFKNRRFPTRAVQKKKRRVSAPRPRPKPRPPEISPETFKLLGVVVEGTVKRALIETRTLSRSWYIEGNRIDNWTLERIDQNGVHLSLNGNEAVLNLYTQPTGN